MAILPLDFVPAKSLLCYYDACRTRGRHICEICGYWICGLHSDRGTPGGWVCDPDCLLGGN